MRRVFIAGFAIIFLGLLGCNAYTNEVDKLIIHTQGPLDGHPFVAYEIEFFPDGMIKRIRQFLLSSDVDLYQWDASTALRTLVSEYVTEREGKRIIQYQVGSQGERLIYSTFEINAGQPIGYNRTGSSYRIDYEDLSEILYYRGGNTLISTVTNNPLEIATVNALSGVKFWYRFDNSQLQELKYEGQGITWEAEISFDGRNEYTIIVPDLNGEVPFAEKVTVLAPQSDSFSQEAVVLNRFITLCIDTGETRFLLPFVSRRLVP